MPVMAPLSDLVGVTRQVAVLAFQLGDGLTNIVVPTSAALMGSLGAARVETDVFVMRREGVGSDETSSFRLRLVDPSGTIYTICGDGDPVTPTRSNKTEACRAHQRLRRN